MTELANPENAPSPLVPASIRIDGWTGDLMARFCEVLAETGIVTQACRAVAKSRETAYSNRRRNPLFAAAWAAALSHARNRLADALLERSIEGSVDYLYRDGELVGERRYIDNRLAYAMLRRLDKQAEADPAPVQAELARRPCPERGRGTCPEHSRGMDWPMALKALRSGSEEDLSAALAMLDDLETGESHEADEADNPPDPEIDTVSFDEFADGRIWEEEPDIWWTNFPPPPGFTGEQRGRWDDSDYARECSDDECALLTAARDAALADTLAEEQADRDSFFAELKDELTAPQNRITRRRGGAETDADEQAEGMASNASL